MDKAQVKAGIKDLIKLFERDKDKIVSERDVCRVFIEPLFSLLGWKMNNLQEVHEQVNQPQGKPDYIFYLDGRIAFYLEAKIIKDHLTDEDIQQAVNYARNRNKRWAVLSDFKETYILICDIEEKTLQKHIFRSLDYSRLEDNLDDLLLLSKDSFQLGKLEQKAQEEGRIKKAIRIDEQLLNDILNWRKALIKSIKDNNSKKYPDEELEQIVQILLNRILFIRTVEDRKQEARADETIKGVLNQYDRDNSINIKNKLNKIFEDYDGIYDSKLFTYDESNFRARHECEKVDIDNTTYYKILKETYDKNTIYSYNFADIDADILGSVYEKYIGKIQKATGIYYTPPYIEEYIISKVLVPYVRDKKLREVERIKVGDIACGSGSFLLKAFDILDNFYKQKDKKSAQTRLDFKGSSSKITRQTRVLKNNIYGVDLDNRAVEIAQLNLLLKIAETRHRLPDLRENLKCGNSLIDSTISKHAFSWNREFPEIVQSSIYETQKESSGFDVIVGNPPWVSFGLRNVGKLPPAESKYYRDNFKSAQYKLSIYALFLEQAIKLVKDGGRVGYILPDSFLLGEFFSKLRAYILENCRIINITLFMYDVFKEKATTGRNVIIVLEKTKAKKNKRVDIVKVERNETLKFTKFSCAQTDFEKAHLNRFRLFFDKESKKLIEKMERRSNPLETYMQGHTGVRALYGQKNIIAKASRGHTWKKGLISGSQIGRYWLKWDDNYINIEPTLLNKGGWDPDIISNPKLLVRQTGDRLFATFDDSGYYHLNNIHSFNLINDKLSIKFILALINSKALNAYYILTTLEKNRVMAQTDIETLELLPIKEISIELQKPFIEVVDELLTINAEILKFTSQTDEKRALEIKRNKLLEKLDLMVYELYNIKSKTEINIIEKALE